MNKYLLFLLLLFPVAVKANTVTPAFTQGSMQSTTTTTQNVIEESHTQVYGGEYSSWAGTNVEPLSTDAHSLEFQVVNEGAQFQYETVFREAGLVEETHTWKDISTESVTTSLSVFSQ